MCGSVIVSKSASLLTKKVSKAADQSVARINVMHTRISKYESIKTKKLVTDKKNYNEKSFKIDETRATHPAWTFRELEQVRWEYPLIDPQMNTEIPFSYNNNSSLDYKDRFIPNIPKPLNK